MKSSRRIAAEESLGFQNEAADQKENDSVKREAERRKEFDDRKNQLVSSPVYKTVSKIRKIMDDFFIDPILGLILPGLGDGITTVLSIPYIYQALVKLKSVPLTLAMIYNLLIDWLLGMIPFYIGDVIDVFHRSFKKNMKLIDGFINRDEKIMQEVNRKSVFFGIMIVIICVAIFFMFKLLAWALLQMSQDTDTLFRFGIK